MPKSEPKADEKPETAPETAPAAPALPFGTTVPGGRYLREDGVLVDANGRPLPAE